MAIGPPQYTSRHEIKPDDKGRNGYWHTESVLRKMLSF